MLQATERTAAACGDPLTAARRIVVISPHLDDAIMSVGASIATAVRAGVAVEVLTVFGYGPRSKAPAGPWDRKSGFGTEAEAAAVRRGEDEAACRMLGATPRWFDFGAEPYERRGSPQEIAAAVAGAVTGADWALMPGYPLRHPDHAELTQILLSANLPCRVGLYVEQPYLFYERKTPSRMLRAAALEPLLPARLDWTHRPASREIRALKSRAMRSYKSQLWQLGLSHIGLMRLLWHETKQGGEAIAWLP